jgi:hypothetical protein
MASPEVLTLLHSSKIVGLVFEEIAKNRSVMFKEILASLGKKNDLSKEDLSKEKIEEVVHNLMEADLVKERAAPIQDFNTYYITADGLSTERQLRLADLS